MWSYLPVTLIWSFWTTTDPFQEEYFLLIHACSWIEWLPPGPLELKFLASSNKMNPGDDPRILKIKSGRSLDIWSLDRFGPCWWLIRIRYVNSSFNLGSLPYLYLRSGKIRMIIPTLSNFDYTQNKTVPVIFLFKQNMQKQNFRNHF